MSLAATTYPLSDLTCPYPLVSPVLWAALARLKGAGRFSVPSRQVSHHVYLENVFLNTARHIIQHQLPCQFVIARHSPTDTGTHATGNGSRKTYAHFRRTNESPIPGRALKRTHTYQLTPSHTPQPPCCARSPLGLPAHQHLRPRLAMLLLPLIACCLSAQGWALGGGSGLDLGRGVAWGRGECI